MRLTSQITLVGSGALGISNQYDCHVYLIESGGELALVDTGVGLETPRILANVQHWGFDPSKISTVFLTHAHADHSGGAHDLAEVLGCRVVTTAADSTLIAEGSEELLGLRAAKVNGAYPADYAFKPYRMAYEASDGEAFRLGDATVRVIHVPGHTPGSACYLLEDESGRSFFSGDALFHGGFVSVLNVPTCDPAAYRESLPRLRGLGVRALFPGHYLWTLSGGQDHINLAIDRMERSVFPNIAIGWLLPHPQAVVH